MLRTLGWICRLALAVIFLYAGYSKLFPPIHRFQFEMVVSAYQLLPAWAVIIVARALPLLEVALGLLLLAGWRLRYVASLASLLLGAFIAAMAVTYARGIEADCGCFGLGEPISPLSLVRDSFFFGMAIFVAVQAWRSRPEPTSQPG